MLAVIYCLVGEEDVIIHTADKKGGEGHHEDELPVKKGRSHEGITLLPPQNVKQAGHRVTRHEDAGSRTATATVPQNEPKVSARVTLSRGGQDDCKGHPPVQPTAVTIPQQLSRSQRRGSLHLHELKDLPDEHAGEAILLVQVIDVNTTVKEKNLETPSLRPHSSPTQPSETGYVPAQGTN